MEQRGGAPSRVEEVWPKAEGLNRSGKSHLEINGGTYFGRYLAGTLASPQTAAARRARLHMQGSTAPLNTAGASEYLGLSCSTLEKLRVFGGGPRYLKLGRVVRYRPSDLDTWLEERIVSCTSERQKPTP